MRIVLALGLLALTALVPANADDAQQAVQWSWQLVPSDAKPGSEAELVLVASVAPHWVVYSSDFESGIGPLPARLKRKPGSGVELLDGLRSVGAKRKRDPAFDGEYGYFNERAELRQRVRLPADGSPAEITLNGQACFEIDGTCHLIRQDIRIDAK